MKKKIFSVLIALMLATSFLLGACAAPEPEAPEPVAPEPVAPEPEKQLVVGFTPISDPFDEMRLTVERTVRQSIEDAGGKWMYCSPSPAGGAVGDPAVQAACMDTFIAAGVDAIIVWAVDPVAMVTSVKKANDADIPVFLYLSNLPKGSGADVVASGQVVLWECGRAAGERIVEGLILKYGEPKGLCLEVQGLMTSTHGQQRSGGFHEVIDQYPDIEVVSKAGDWDPDKGATIVKDWMTANPETDAILMATLAGYVFASRAFLMDIGRWQKIGHPDHIIMSGGDDLALTLYAIKCGYIEGVYSHGVHAMGGPFATLVMDYLKTGVFPKVGDRIPTGFTTYPYVEILRQEDVDELVVGVVGLAITAENCDLPDLFGNLLEEAPNGISPDCGTSGLDWDE